MNPARVQITGFIALLLSRPSQEKRKRQTEIEDKRSQLDDLVVQLQHLKVGWWQLMLSGLFTCGVFGAQERLLVLSCAESFRL